MHHQPEIKLKKTARSARLISIPVSRLDTDFHE